MSNDDLTFIKLPKEKVEEMIFRGAQKGMEKLEPRLAQIEKKFKFMAPSFDRETAAAYCNKSVNWIDKQRTQNNLPAVNVGDGQGHPRILKEDLDHLLTGGTFDDDGNPLKPKKISA